MTASTRLKIGIAFATGGNVLFFTSAWIAWMPWSASTKAAVWGALFFAPEVGTLLGAAIMGKENYKRFKTAAFAFIGRMKPAGDIGIWRHRIGIAMFLIPIVPTYIQAYKPELLPDGSAWRWEIKIAADIIFIASLFVLGGDFWDKLHALFIREARVHRIDGATGPSSQDEPPPASRDDA